MNERRILAAVFLLLAIGAGYLTLLLWQADESGKWLFLVFAVFFLCLAAAPFLPATKPKPAPPPPTGFVSHRFMTLVMVVIVLAILAAIVSAILAD